MWINPPKYMFLHLQSAFFSYLYFATNCNAAEQIHIVWQLDFL